MELAGILKNTGLLVASFLCALGNLALTARAAELPNFVVILTDDQGWGTTSIQYDPDVSESKSDFFQTPNLERLAKMGMRFTDGYASHPNCSPSRAALLTGRSPAALKFTDIVGRHKGKFYEGNRMIPPKHLDGLPGEEVTLPEIIKQHLPDYKAAHFGKWHLKAGGPESHGFDAGDRVTGNGEGNEKDNLPADPKRAFSITKRGNEWMEQQVKAGNPFYLQISHYAVHLNYQSKPETTTKFEQAKAGKRHQNVQFAAMIYDMDAAIGQTLDKIKELGIQDKTYIIYTADNGTYPTKDAANINGPLRGTKATVWEGGIRVPFIVAGPGIAGDSVSRRTVVGYDIYPTICDILGISELPEKIEGGSFKHLLGSPDSFPVKRAHGFLVFHWPHYVHGKKSKPDTTIRMGDMKLHYFYETEQSMLFDLGKDPAEQNELAPTMPEKATELKKAMMAYLKTIDANMPTKNPDYDPAKDPAKALAKKGQKKPNVVIIFTDDQGWGDIGCFGLEKGKTPHLDRMASEGMKFTDFYVNAAQCSASRAALMTGCHYQRISMPVVSWPNESGGFHASETTLAELLKAEDYATACIGKWHLGHRPGFLPIDQGFDYYYGIPYSNDMTYDPEMVRSKDLLLREGWTHDKLNAYQKTKENNRKVPLMRGREVIEFPANQSTLTQRYTQEAVNFIREHRDEPFFVYLPHTMPHNPLAVSKAFEPDLTNSKNQSKGLYAKVIEEIDWSVGEILQTLKALDLDQNTLVMFTSDNGPDRGSTGGLRGSKGTVYEGGMRVPCIMKWPETIPAGTTCSEVATTLDLLPTIAAMVGGKVPTDRIIDGHNILPLMEGDPNATSPNDVYAYLYKDSGVRSGKWKFYPFRAGTGSKDRLKEGDPRAVAPVQLYDLSTDLYEEQNLADQHPEVVVKLQKALDDLRTDIENNKRPSGHSM
ncbi:MAG: sulfatase-like hydrolase/transferase [Verrucomicrobia bacterium]|jgi:arylsulfatase A|nr:sulfatase-like hydrolase/transferase [Verrucomicrobiota bacterium]